MNVAGFAMRSLRRWILLTTLFVTPLFADFNLDTAKAYVDSLLPESKFGLSVRSVKTGKEIFNINGGEYFTPASTMKTLSTATAVHFLPLDYAPETKVSLKGSLYGNVFQGTLKVRGEGDPNVSARYYTDPMYWLYAIADSVKSLGIDTVYGTIDLDSSYYVGPWRPEHWRNDFYDFWYGAEVTPLQFNDNCALIRVKPGANEGDTALVSVLPDVGYVKVTNSIITKVAPRNKRGCKKRLKWTRDVPRDRPEVILEGEIDIDTDSSQITIPVRGAMGYYKAALLTALRQRNVHFVETSKFPEGFELLKFSFSAAPFLSILDEINQKSQNLHAETLFRNMAAQVGGEGGVETGKRLERKFLTEMGVDTSGFVVYDGCGLSGKNKLKPSAETQMLAAMARHPKGAYYMNSFANPRAGSGSKRMYTLDHAWLTRFKTGYIAEVHGLAGYIFSMAGDTLSVAMYLNETGKNPDTRCKDVMDTLWVHLIEYFNDGYPSLLRMKELWISGGNVKDFAGRLEYFSRMLIGTPYRLGPMGEGHLDKYDRKPLVNLDSVDCVTYLEHALALANATHEDSLFNVLQRIRYYDGKISFRYRKHYMLEDWVGEGKFAKPVRMDGDTSVTRIIDKMAFFASKKIPYMEANPQLQINYLTPGAAIAWANKIYNGPLKVMGVAFVSKLSKIDAYHTGFIVLKPGSVPLLRHASQIRGRVVELPFAEYLETAKKKALGVSFFEFVPR